MPRVKKLREDQAVKLLSFLNDQQRIGHVSWSQEALTYALGAEIAQRYTYEVTPPPRYDRLGQEIVSPTPAKHVMLIELLTETCVFFGVPLSQHTGRGTEARLDIAALNKRVHDIIQKRFLRLQELQAAYTKYQLHTLDTTWSY